MKLTRSFKQITSSAIITAGVVIGYFQILQTSNSSFFKSGRITWGEAKTLSDEFVNHKLLKVTHTGYPTGNGLDTTEPLRGFVFDADDLREILNTNRSRETPDEVVFYLGREEEKVGDWPFRHSAIHIIAVGRKANKLLIEDKMTGKNEPSIYDKADPCPPFCAD